MSSLKLGNLQFANNIIQGPLAGVSCAPFRLLTWQYGKPAFSCTEMISCKTLLHAPQELQYRYVKKDPQEGPVCFQLSGSHIEELGAAVRVATAYGADLIDLNCGCPVNKIRSKGAGSSLLSQAGKLYQLITAMKQNTHVPVSVKIRVEGNSTEKFNEDIAKAVEDAGVDFLVVHGRHWTEHYETPCRLDQIQFFVERLQLPVIGNGDVSCVTSLRKMLDLGCAGVMIGRAGVGQPWLAAQLIAELNQQPFSLPTLAERAAIYLQHVTGLAELLNSERFAILQSRKLAKYYARTLSNRNEFCMEMNKVEDIKTFKSLCESYFVSQ